MLSVKSIVVYTALALCVAVTHAAPVIENQQETEELVARAEIIDLVSRTEIVEFPTRTENGLEIRAAKCRPSGAFKTLVAKYDDLIFREAPDPPTPIGTYNELKYGNFYVDQYDGAIQAASGTQWAMSYDSTKARVVNVTKEGDFFNLQSFYIACSSGYPQPACNIQLYGYGNNGRTRSGFGFKYPALDNTKPFVMMKVEFYAQFWSNLSYIEFASARLEDGREVGLMLDNLTYEKKTCK